MPLSRVLVIDDDDNIRTSLKRALSYAGFTVEVAEHGEAGLQKALVAPPDVVVLDIMMPGLSGLEVCRLREGDGVPILMLTARDDIPDRVMGLGREARTVCSALLERWSHPRVALAAITVIPSKRSKRFALLRDGHSVLQ